MTAALLDVVALEPTGPTLCRPRRLSPAGDASSGVRRWPGCRVRSARLCGRRGAWSGVPKNELSWYRNDGTRVLLVVDESQDSINYSVPQLEGLIYALATYAAQTQGSLSVAGLRNNTISALRFSDPIAFSTRKHSDVQRRRDLTAQRNAVDLAHLARVIRAAQVMPPASPSRRP